MAEDNNRSNLYLGTGINLNSLNINSISESGGLGASANIGYNFNDYIGVEFRKSTSLTNEANLLLDDSMALYAKGKYPILNDLSVYLLAGYSSNDVSQGSQVINESSFTYGGGLEYHLSTSVALYSDYTSSSSLSQIGFGVAYYYDHKGLADLPPDAPEVQTFKQKKHDEKLMEELRIKEKLEEKKKKEEEARKKKEAEEKLKRPTIVKLNLLHKEDTKKPILVYFFELKSNNEFKRMDYEEIIINEKEMLGGEVINRSKEILKPGKMKTFEFNVKFDSEYFAVVVALNDVRTTDDWRHIVKVNAHEINEINLMLDHRKIMEFTK